MTSGGQKEITCYSEEDLLPISALQHLMFCPRQCALIHIEQLWSENRLTAEGRTRLGEGAAGWARFAAKVMTLFEAAAEETKP